MAKIDVVSLIIVRFSIRNHRWKARDLSPFLNLSDLTLLVHEPDYFSVPNGGTKSGHVVCKDRTLECSLSCADLKLLGMMIQSMEMSTKVHNVPK